MAIKNKRIIFLILFFIFNINIVKANENKLIFTNNGNKIYYKTFLYNEDNFIKHTDMIPGKVYQDELIIENMSDKNYNLYLKIEDSEQNELSKELLNNIEMVIYLDDELIYKGSTLGENYQTNGLEIKNSIDLHKIDKNDIKNLTVKTKLKEEYSNINNNELAKIKWTFYARTGDEINIINPDTGDSIFKLIKEIILLFITLIILLFIMYKIKSLM